MARFVAEFQCDGRGTWKTNSENCGWWNYPVLDTNMTGNYVIVCGHCGHEHYRTIKDGVVTADRHTAKYGEAERILVMPSACSEKKRELSPIQQLRQHEVAGLNRE